MSRYMIGGAWLKALPFLVVAVPLVPIVGVFLADPGRRWVAVVSAVPWVFILAVILLFFRWGFPWLAARLVQREDPSVKGDIKHIVSDHGFTIQTVAATVDLTWDHIRQVVETPDYFLWYHNRRCAYFTPKSAIPQSDLESLRSAVRAHLVAGARFLIRGLAAT
jgi:hypothetical protein